MGKLNFQADKYSSSSWSPLPLFPKKKKKTRTVRVFLRQNRPPANKTLMAHVPATTTTTITTTTTWDKSLVDHKCSPQTCYACGKQFSQITKNPRALDRLSRPVPLEKENPFVYNFLNIKCSTFYLCLQGENAATFLSGHVAQNRLQIRKHGRKPVTSSSSGDGRYADEQVFTSPLWHGTLNVPEFWHLVFHHHTCSSARLRNYVTNKTKAHAPAMKLWPY